MCEITFSAVVAGLLYAGCLDPVVAQSPVTVVGPITPGDCAAFSSTTVIKDSGFSCPNLTNGLRISPTPSSLIQGLGITQTAAGTIAGGTPFTFTTANALNYINVSSDSVNNGDGNEYSAFGIIHKTGGATVTGQRSGFHVEQWLTAATGAETEKDIVGATLQVFGQVGNSGGNFIASNSVAFLSGSGAGGLSGHEIDIEAIAGSSTTNKFGLTIVQVSPDAVQGSTSDAGIAYFNNGTSGGWKTGIAFNASTVASGGVAIDMSALTLGGPAFFLKGPGGRLYIDGNSNISVNTVTVVAGSPTPIIVGGTASGQGTFSVPAALGTPSWTLPTNTGTFAVSASSPLAVNAATGNLSLTGTVAVANGGTGDTGTAWASYSPGAVTCGSGTITATTTAVSKSIGKTFYAHIDLTETSNAACAGSITIATALPATPNHTTTCSGMNKSTGIGLAIFVTAPGANSINFNTASGATPITANSQFLSLDCTFDST